MTATFRKDMIVEFSDTDMAGIAHFSRFFLYAERTEHAFLRSLGLSAACRPCTADKDPAPTDALPGWPRVHASFDYLSPLRFEDSFAVTLGVERIGEHSVHYRFLVQKAEQVCARGRIVAAHVHIDRQAGSVQSAPVPRSFLDKVRALDASELADFLD